MKTPVSSTSDQRQRRKRQVHQRSKIALFDVFRDAFADRDSRSRILTAEEMGGQNSVTEVSTRSNARRLGVSEETLRDHVRDHLRTLMNTVRLDAAVDLSDTPLVARSVVNYGFQDLSSLSRQELQSQSIAASIRQSLADHEPRLVPDTLEVKVIMVEGDEFQRVAVHVTADLIADPADVQISFTADVDTGAGKVILQAHRI